MKTFEDGVKEGIMIAQRWVPVASGHPSVPEGEIETPYYLVKDRNETLAVSRYCALLRTWLDISTSFKVTHYRAIEQ